MSRPLPLDLDQVEVDAFRDWDAPPSAKLVVLVTFAHRNHAAALERVEALLGELLEARDLVEHWEETFMRLVGQVVEQRRLERLAMAEELRRSRELEDTPAPPPVADREVA